MSKRESIARYSLIINKMRKGPATFSDISHYLDIESDIQSYNFNISKRTFQRDLRDIRSIYNIDIQFDFSRKVYYIDFDEKDDISERILEAFDTFNALNISDRISNDIHFEKRRPLGTENFHGLLHAIKNKRQIKFSYKKFWDDQGKERKAEPYALKEFKNRWYVIALDVDSNTVKTFALDRLTELEICKRKFQQQADFNVNDYFRYCFGIIGPDGKQQDIVLSFNNFQGNYIKSLPLHHTQEILVDNEKELRIKLKLYITHDFIMELLSLGENVQVIKPKALIETLVLSYKNALNNYSG